MKQEKIGILLKALNSKRTGFRAGWVEGPCPLAPWKHANGKDAHPSFGIKSEDKKKSICKCLSCGFGGDLMDLLFQVSGLKKKQDAVGYKMAYAAQLVASEFDDMECDVHGIPEYGDEKPKAELVFPESWLESFKSATKFSVAMEYLHSRGVSNVTIDALDVRYDPLQHRIGFPFRNFKGQLMGVQGRSLDKITDLRYYHYGYHGTRNLHAWMGENTLDMDKPVVLCEGPFDYAAIYPVYPNVAASFTSGLSVEKCKRLGDAESIITLYDYGAGGNAARKRLREVLKGIPVKHVIPTEQQDDAGNMSLAEITAALKGLVELNPVA